MTYDACVGPAQLVAATCNEIAMAAHNTDAHEWLDLSAHSQIEEGQAACAGADAALTRVRQLGGEARVQLFAQAAPGASADQVASAGRAALVALGRALHTVQDNCAHHGMPNPQHAWWSDSDLCLGTALSPDLPDAAVSCAQAETEAAFESFAAAFKDAGLGGDALFAPDAVQTAGPQFPSREGICGYLHSSGTWDGVDRGWDNAWMGPALREELRRGLLGLEDPAPEACALPAGTLDLKSPADKVRTSNAGIGCQAIEAICVGDPTEPIEPPWEGKKAPKDLSCEAAPGGLFALGAAWLWWRRRRRPPAARPAGP
ncbi:MAG TPA: hypothetical protein VND93_20315 [Myxococcales bacterium]|nr:hypothetical protein [Myxococcales bacterium]